MPARSARRALVALPALLIGLACGPAPDRAEPADTVEASAVAPTLEAATRIGLRNARSPSDGLVTGGQPSEGQFAALADAGYTRFISLRPEAEDGAGWEEAYAAEHAHAFERLPIAGAASLTRENVETFAALLAEAGAEPTVVYCASGNRVGALMALKAFWLDGAEPEDALQLGLDAGMTRLTAPVTRLLGLEEGR